MIYKNISSVNDHDILLAKCSPDWILTFRPGKCKVLVVANNSIPVYDDVMQ